MIPPDATRHGVPSGVLLIWAAVRATTMLHITGGGGMYQKPLLSLDQTRRANPQTFAVRKAYTSAMSGQDSVAYAERLKSQGRSVSDMGNPNLVAAQGAVVVLHPQSGAVLGAIGVSGLTAQEDEDLARLGLQALGL